MHALFVWVFFITGQALHILGRANLSIASKANAVGGYREYFRIKGVAIAQRFFLDSCLFLAFGSGLLAAYLPNFIPPSLDIKAQIAIAGIFGFGADSLLDQVFTKAGLDKELPPPTG